MRQPSKTLLTAVFLWTLHYKTVINPHNMLWQQKSQKWYTTCKPYFILPLLILSKTRPTFGLL